MSDPNQEPPTADEIAAAEAIMRRVAAANAAATAAVLPDVRDFVADDAFDRLVQAGAGLCDRLPRGTPLHSHLGAMIVGMTNLRNDPALA